jgi:hypothetical protein
MATSKKQQVERTLHNRHPSKRCIFDPKNLQTRSCSLYLCTTLGGLYSTVIIQYESTSTSTSYGVDFGRDNASTSTSTSTCTRTGLFCYRTNTCARTNNDSKSRISAGTWTSSTFLAMVFVMN